MTLWLCMSWILTHSVKEVKIFSRPKKWNSCFCRYLVVCNPSEQDRISVISVYVSSPTAQVSSASGKPVELQISAVWDTANTISQTTYEVCFFAMELVCMPILSCQINVCEVVKVVNTKGFNWPLKWHWRKIDSRVPRWLS